MKKYCFFISLLFSSPLIFRQSLLAKNNSKKLNPVKKSTQIKELNNTQSFNKALQSKHRSILLLYQPSCSHCPSAKEYYKEIAEKIPNIYCYQVNIETISSVPTAVKGVPSFIFIENGKIYKIIANNKTEIESILQEWNYNPLKK